MKKQNTKTIAELEGVPNKRTERAAPKSKPVEPKATRATRDPLAGIPDKTIRQALDFIATPGFQAPRIIAEKCGISEEAARVLIDFHRHEADEQRRARGRRRVNVVGHCASGAFIAPEPQEIGLPGLPSSTKGWGI